MKLLPKIICRTVGTAGMGLALFDAMKVGGQTSRNTSQATQGKYLEKLYFNNRTIENTSFVSNGMRHGTFNVLSSSPIASLWGRIKGWFQGTLCSLGNNLPIVACSAFALLSKGTMAKVGAIGTGLVLCYDILRNGLGFGKHNPMD
ncbi:hypothetical protein IJD34_01955 [bacterium]|nr:hypothetical protein [bacterium]